MKTCPMCNKGTLRRGTKREVMFGIDFGVYSAELCDYCGESFISGASMARIERIAKKKGVWGLGRKTKVSRSGNSLAVRIPKEIVKFLNIREGQDAYIYPEKKKIVIEPA